MKTMINQRFIRIRESRVSSVQIHQVQRASKAGTVILKGYSIDSLNENILRECLGIMFPECEIEIHSNPPVHLREGEVHRALETLWEKKVILEKGAQLLLEKEKIEGGEIKALMEGKS